MSIAQVRARLKDLIESSESLYEIILDRFPNLERSMELTYEEAEILLDYFIRTKQSDEEKVLLTGQVKHFRVTEILNEIGSNIEMVDQALLHHDQISELLKLFNTTDNDDTVNISSLLSIVKVIDNALRDIDLVALNAIIYAGRLGSRGAPFSIIAENIKKLSLVMATSNELVNQQFTSLEQWLDEFKHSIGELLVLRNSITSEHTQQVKIKFSQSIDSLGEIGALLHNLLQNVSSIIEPGRQLMVLIQNQDIIRQGIENLSELMASIEKSNITTNSQPGQNERNEILDQATFQANTTLLAERLMANLIDRLNESTLSIDQILSHLSTQLVDVCEDSHYLSIFFGGSMKSSAEKGSVDLTFDEIIQFMDKFVQAVGELGERNKQLNLDQRLLIGKLEETRVHIDTINKQIGQLKKSRLLSNIELARLNLQDHSFGQEMEQVIEYVIQAISENRKLFQQLRSVIELNLDKLDTTMLKSQGKLKFALEVTQRSREELEVTNGIVNQAIHALNLELVTLNANIASLKKDFAPAKDLRKNCEEILAMIRSIKDEAQGHQQYYLDYFGETNWETKNEKIAKEIRKFTTYAEKLTAKELFGQIELDESTEGELTLF